MGAKFKIYLPAHEAASQKEPEEERPEIPFGNGELILVIDDEAAVREMIRTTLERFGYQALTADNGATALGIFAGHKDEISVVITDMMMPVMDGPVTIRALQKLNPQVHIIASSGLTESIDAADLDQLGVLENRQRIERAQPPTPLEEINRRHENERRAPEEQMRREKQIISGSSPAGLVSRAKRQRACLLCNVLPRLFQPIVERCAIYPQPMSRRRMTPQSGPLPLINRQHYPAKVFYERFTLLQLGQGDSATWRKRGLSFKVHLAAYMVCSNYPAAGFGPQALDR